MLRAFHTTLYADADTLSVLMTLTVTWSAHTRTSLPVAVASSTVELIIMGTQGRTRFQHVVLGSVAEKVVRLAPCPVLVARQPTVTVVPVS